MIVTALIAGAGLLAVLVGVAAAVYIALLRRITLPSRPKLVSLKVADGVVELERSDATTLEGTFGVWVNDGRGHLSVGAVIDPAAEGPVRRRLISTFGDSASATQGRWTGHAFPHASALGADFQDVVIESALGGRDAWLFSGSPQRWAIHIHGFKSMRASALRGVPAFLAAGFTSLVPAYYGESPAADRNTREGATFGEAEAVDVEAAVSFAVDHGAEEIVLVGWSLGAEVALSLALRAANRSRIVGVVLIGPALNWRWSLDEGMREGALPRWVRRAVLRSLQSRLWSRFARMSAPADFSAHDWVSADRIAPVPTLLLHSAGDTDTSWDDSQKFAANSPELVDLVKFDPVPHLMEWNTQRTRFEESVVDWADRLSRRSGVAN